jgi:hypothetical protein
MPWRWSTVGGKVDLGVLIAATGFLCLITSAFPASFILRRFQKKYDRTHAPP